MTNNNQMEEAYRLINERIVGYLYEKIMEGNFDISILDTPTGFLEFNQITEEQNKILFDLRVIMAKACKEIGLEGNHAFSVASSSYIDIKEFKISGNDSVIKTKQAYDEYNEQLSKER